jgi:hypothetical protein
MNCSTARTDLMWRPTVLIPLSHNKMTSYSYNLYNQKDTLNKEANCTDPAQSVPFLLTGSRTRLMRRPIVLTPLNQYIWSPSSMDIFYCKNRLNMEANCTDPSQSIHMTSYSNNLYNQKDRLNAEVNCTDPLYLLSVPFLPTSLSLRTHLIIRPFVLIPFSQYR